MREDEEQYANSMSAGITSKATSWTSLSLAALCRKITQQK